MNDTQRDDTTRKMKPLTHTLRVDFDAAAGLGSADFLAQLAALFRAAKGRGVISVAITCEVPDDSEDTEP